MRQERPGSDMEAYLLWYHCVSMVIFEAGTNVDRAFSARGRAASGTLSVRSGLMAGRQQVWWSSRDDRLHFKNPQFSCANGVQRPCAFDILDLDKSTTLRNVPRDSLS